MTTKYSVHVESEQHTEEYVVEAPTRGAAIDEATECFIDEYEFDVILMQNAIPLNRGD